MPTLFPKYDCRRRFDTGPVPALWLFGAAAEDYIALLYELAIGPKGQFGNDWFIAEQRKAKEIFLSPEFRSVLHGHLAEEYFPRIEELKSYAP